MLTASPVIIYTVSTRVITKRSSTAAGVPGSSNSHSFSGNYLHYKHTGHYKAQSTLGCYIFTDCSNSLSFSSNYLHHKHTGHLKTQSTTRVFTAVGEISSGQTYSYSCKISSGRTYLRDNYRQHEPIATPARYRQDGPIATPARYRQEEPIATPAR